METNRLTQPRYSYSEAERIAGLTHGTAKRWLKGYGYTTTDGDRQTQPAVSTGKSVDEYGVSFVELIELAVISRMKEEGLSVQAIRRVVDRCRELFRSSHPLSEFAFKMDGRSVFVSSEDGLVSVGLTPSKGQRAWHEVLAPFLESIEYEADVARRWWPLGRDRGVVVDPAIGFGSPVVAARGVRTETIYEQFELGVVPPEIREDFDLTDEQTWEAIRFEAQRHRAPLVPTG